MSTPTNPSTTAPRHPTFGEAFRVWCRVAALSFGGPAGQIAVMHRILVEEKRWVSENRFLHALNYCMLLPGPEAQQLATYNGWLLHRTLGGLTAGSLFILPGFVSILALSLLYAGYRDQQVVAAIFYGITPAVLAVVIDAVLRIGKRVLKRAAMLIIAALAFVGIFFLNVPFPLIVLGAGLVGFIGGRWWPGQFHVIRVDEDGDDPKNDVAVADDAAGHTNPTLGRALRVSAIWLSLWFGPLIALALTLGSDHVYVQEGLFFSKAAVVTFGGAYAVLAYVAQQAVQVYGWLMPGEMLHGLAMAETTPGPLLQVVQFVGFMGAYRDPGTLTPMTAGILASLIVTWVTFVPCFLWIFLGAPYIEKLRKHKTLTAALSSVTAAVVGVILNLAIWFGLHTLFAHVEEVDWFVFRLWVPSWREPDIMAMALAAGALIAMLRFKLGMIPTLFLAACAGAAYRLLVT